MNTILAVLEIRGVISHEEAEKLADYISTKPQPTEIDESVKQVQELLAGTPVPTAPPVGPVGPEQHAEEQAARLAAPPVPPNPAPANETPVEFPTLPGAKESTGNDLSIDEMSETAKETNKTGNQENVVDEAKSSDNAPASDSEKSDTSSSDNGGKSSIPEPKSEALKSAVKKSTKK